jgi:hypothetical protein
MNDTRRLFQKGIQPVFRVAAVCLLLFAVSQNVSSAVTGIIPGVANAGGLDGADWITRLSLGNPFPDRDVAVTIALFGNDGPKNVSRSYVIPPTSNLEFENVLGEVFGYRGVAYLRLTADNSFLRVSARTVHANACGGQAGQELPLIQFSCQFPEYIDLQWSCHQLPFLRRPTERVNIGTICLAGCNGESATMGVTLYDSSGTVLGSKNFRQEDETTTIFPLSELNEEFLSGYINAGICDLGAGHVKSSILFVSLIDEVSRDARFAATECHVCY